MSTIGLIGAGHIGSQVARLAVKHGHDVVVSNSRGPETLKELVAELGPRARAATSAEAAEAGDIVVVTIPLKNIGQVPVAPLAGKIVIDTNNYYPDRDGHIAGYEGTEEMFRKYGGLVVGQHFPALGTPTQSVEAGYMANAWMRLRHPDFDVLHGILNEIGERVQVRAH